MSAGIIVTDRCPWAVKFPKAIEPAEARGRFHACIEGEPGKWDCGSSRGHAVDRLRLTWPEAVGLPWIDAPVSP